MFVRRIVLEHPSQSSSELPYFESCSGPQARILFISTVCKICGEISLPSSWEDKCRRICTALRARIAFFLEEFRVL